MSKRRRRSLIGRPKMSTTAMGTPEPTPAAEVPAPTHAYTPHDKMFRGWKPRPAPEPEFTDQLTEQELQMLKLAAALAVVSGLTALAGAAALALTWTYFL